MSQKLYAECQIREISTTTKGWVQPPGFLGSYDEWEGWNVLMTDTALLLKTCLKPYTVCKIR